MKENTKLIRLLKKIMAANSERFAMFKQHFITSTFCLFFGFMCGNLFGTFLTFFRTLIHWDGAIIALLLLFIEWINYLNFVFLKKHETYFSLASKNEALGLFKTPTPVSCGVTILSFVNSIRLVFQSTFTFLKQTLLFPITNESLNRTTPKKLMQRKNSSVPNQKNTSSRLNLNLVLCIRFFNFFKLGLLLGFFIDAFKVGS